MTSSWTDLTTRLKSGAKRGDRETIRTWAAHWGERRNIEVAVWIELDEQGKPVEVKAGTASLPYAVRFPPRIRARFNDANARIEIWHNHPSLGGAAGIAVPGPEDIAFAMCKGIELVGTVDDGQRRKHPPRWSTVHGQGKDTVSPLATLVWTRNAQASAEIWLETKAEPMADATDQWAEFALKIEIAKMVVGAAEAVGLLKSEGVLDEISKQRGEWVARETNRQMGTPTALTEEIGWTHEAALSKETTQGTSQWQTQARGPGSWI